MAAASKSTGVFEFRLDSWNKYTLVNIDNKDMEYRSENSANFVILIPIHLYFINCAVAYIQYR